MKFFVIFQYDAFGAPMEFEKFDAYRDALGRFMCVKEFFPDRSIFIVEVCRDFAKVVASHRSNQL